MAVKNCPAKQCEMRKSNFNDEKDTDVKDEL